MRTGRVERKRQVDPFNRAELSDDEWRKVEPLLPPRWREGTRGRPCREHRTLLNGVLWVLRSGAAWRDLPVRYGPWQTAYMRFRRWRCEGRLREIVERLGLVLPDQHRWDGLSDEARELESETDDRAAKPYPTRGANHRAIISRLNCD